MNVSLTRSGRRSAWEQGLQEVGGSLSFLIMPESPSPLLGRDILSKVQDSIFMNMEPALFLSLIKQNVNPKVWADQKIVG